MQNGGIWQYENKIEFFSLCYDSTTEIPWQDNFTKKIPSFLPDRLHSLHFLWKVARALLKLFRIIFYPNRYSNWIEKKKIPSLKMCLLLTIKPSLGRRICNLYLCNSCETPHTYTILLYIESSVILIIKKHTHNQ